MNSVQRVDSWGENDDQQLARIVLKHIREGTTKKKAFEEAGKELERTVHACSFRWNNVVKDRYEVAVNLAKKARENMMKQRGGMNLINQAVTIPLSEPKALEPTPQPIETTLLEKITTFFEEHEELKEELMHMKEENERLHKELLEAKQAKIKWEHNQQMMMEITERMKQLTAQ